MSRSERSAEACDLSHGLSEESISLVGAVALSGGRSLSGGQIPFQPLDLRLSSDFDAGCMRPTLVPERLQRLLRDAPLITPWTASLEAFNLTVSNGDCSTSAVTGRRAPRRPSTTAPPASHLRPYVLLGLAVSCVVAPYYFYTWRLTAHRCNPTYTEGL